MLLVVVLLLLQVPSGVARAAEISVEAGGGPDVSARGAVLWEPATDTILFDREARVGRPMASTTKIMTVLLALEHAGADDLVRVSERAAQIGATPGGATLGLRAGAEVRMESLLAGLMLRSGNDAAVAVAEHVSGTETAFVDLMNDTASAMGLADTRFVNSSGLTDDPGHHASPLDLARLAAVAMERPDFATWAAAEVFDGDELGMFDTRNELLARFPGATGVKTGFTSLAGMCLVASATRDGRTLYAVVLGSDDSFADADALLTHGFEDFRAVPLGSGPALPAYRWTDAAVDVGLADDVAVTVPIDARVSRRVIHRPLLERPVGPGAQAGEAVLLVDGVESARVPLRVGSAADGPSFVDPAAEVGAVLGDALLGLVRIGALDQAL